MKQQINRCWAVLCGLLAVMAFSIWSMDHPDRPMLEVAGGPSHFESHSDVGGYARHSWEIHNVGSSVMTLRTRFTSGRCGFSLWQGEEHELLAGARRTISLTWPLPENASIPFGFHAEVWTNDPLLPKIRFRVAGVSGSAR